MKKYVLIILAIITSTAAVAKVTEADVARDRAWAASQNPSVPQSVIDNQWDKYNNPPNETGGKSTYVRFSLNPPSDSVRSKTLKPTSTYICALSKIGGYYGRGLKGFDANVHESGSNWVLTVGKNCGGCDNWGEAICWTK